MSELANSGETEIASIAPTSATSDDSIDRTWAARFSYDEDRFHSVVVVTEPASIEAEAIRGLRTRIMAQHVREGRRALAVCGATEEAGSTFVAANLGTAMAQIGVKTVIVDADLRKPGIAAMFGLPDDKLGLTDYLANEDVSFDDVIQSFVMPHLSVVCAGALVANPQELLSASRFKLLVDQLLREFDLAIFDTTPTSGCTDAQRVATVAGYSLVVARKHKSYVNDVATLAKLLRADRSVVVGTVLNQF
jgi:capsular exopolysaccharide synthesis family protein